MGEGEILFSAKCGDWVVVKKTTIDEKTTKPEIVYMLTSISETIGRKGFEFSGIDVAAIDALAGQAAKGRRKGFGSIAEVFGSLKTAEIKAALLAAAREEIKYPIAEAYFVRKVMENLGYSFMPSREVLQAIYPELKIPKPRGRFKK